MSTVGASVMGSPRKLSHLNTGQTTPIQKRGISMIDSSALNSIRNSVEIKPEGIGLANEFYTTAQQ